MIIIWTGVGILVPIIVVLFGVIINSIFENVGIVTDVFLLVGFCSGVACWYLGKYLNNTGKRTFIDKETGEEILVRRKDTFFFINIQYWGPMLWIISIVQALGTIFKWY